MGSPIVEIVEVGPRDGLQNEDRTLAVDARIDLIQRLIDTGIRRIEAASFVRADRVPQMAGAEEVLSGIGAPEGVDLIGLVLNRRGAERAAATSCSEFNIVIPVTDGFSTRNQGAPTSALLEHAKAAVDVAHDAGKRASVTLSVSFGCPFEGRVSSKQVAAVVNQVADFGIDELAFADTIGVGVPTQVHALADIVAGDARIPRLRFHFHNTRNTGYVNAWAATQLDLAEYGNSITLDSSVGGFGGCPFAPAATGNIATEDLLYQARQSGATIIGADAHNLAGLGDIAAWLSDELDSPVQALLGKAGDFIGE